MIKASINEVHDGCVIEIKGHAGYAPCGEDIVCAGVSALAGAVTEKLDEMSGEGLIHYRARCISPGYVFLDFAPADNRTALDRAATVTDVLYKGLWLIENEFPQCLSIE